MAFTTNEIAFILLVFVAGFLLGIIVAPSGRKWKHRYEEERDAHAATRAEHDRLVREYRPGTAVGDLDLRRR